MNALVDPLSILAVVLGAQEWPDAGLQGSDAFLNSADSVLDYVTSTRFLGIPRDNLLDLFDSTTPGPQQVMEIGRFLKRRSHELHTSAVNPALLLLYFVGHGAFLPGSNDYYLLVRGTDREFPLETGLHIKGLAGCLRAHATWLRRVLILDCCFAGAAGLGFQSSQLEVAARQTVTAMPARGTALLCSSSSDSPSRAVPGKPYTMFTGSLRKALRAGHPGGGESLSLFDVRKLTWEVMQADYPDEAICPVLQEHDAQGILAEEPLFPNPGAGLNAGLQATRTTVPHFEEAKTGPHETGTHRSNQAPHETRPTKIRAPVAREVRKRPATIAGSTSSTDVRDQPGELPPTRAPEKSNPRSTVLCEPKVTADLVKSTRAGEKRLGDLKERDDRIVSVIQAFAADEGLGPDKGVFVGDIPPERLEKAHAMFSLTSADRVLAIIATVSGNDDQVVFTTKAVYFRSWGFFSDSKGRIPYEVLKKNRVTASWSEIVVSDKIKIDAIYLDIWKTQLASLLNELRSV